MLAEFTPKLLEELIAKGYRYFVQAPLADTVSANTSEMTVQFIPTRLHQDAMLMLEIFGDSARIWDFKEDKEESLDAAEGIDLIRFYIQHTE